MNNGLHLFITDPVYKGGTSVTGFKTFLLRFINDKRDLPFLRLCCIICLTTIPAAIYLFIPGNFNWWLALIYFLLNSGLLMGSFILMLHNTSHRALFKRKYNSLNKIIP